MFQISDKYKSEHRWYFVVQSGLFAFDAFDILWGGIFFRQPCRRVLETTKEKKVSNLCVLLKFSGALVQCLQFLSGTPYLDIHVV